MNWYYLIPGIDPHWIHDFDIMAVKVSHYEDHGILTASKKMELSSQKCSSPTSTWSTEAKILLKESLTLNVWLPDELYLPMHDDIVAPVMKDLGEGYRLHEQLFAHALQPAHGFERYLGFPSPFRQPAHSSLFQQTHSDAQWVTNIETSLTLKR
jgi:hypothetical protein